MDLSKFVEINERQQVVDQQIRLIKYSKNLKAESWKLRSNDKIVSRLCYEGSFTNLDNQLGVLRNEKILNVENEREFKGCHPSVYCLSQSGYLHRFCLSTGHRIFYTPLDPEFTYKFHDFQSPILFIELTFLICFSCVIQIET